VTPEAVVVTSFPSPENHRAPISESASSTVRVLTDPAVAGGATRGIRAALLLGGLWIVISAVAEGVCAWNLPHVGETRFYDGGRGVGALGVLGLVALALAAIGIAGAESLDRYSATGTSTAMVGNHPDDPRRQRARVRPGRVVDGG